MLSIPRKLVGPPSCCFCLLKTWLWFYATKDQHWTVEDKSMVLSQRFAEMVRHTGSSMSGSLMESPWSTHIWTKTIPVELLVVVVLHQLFAAEMCFLSAGQWLLGWCECAKKGYVDGFFCSRKERDGGSPGLCSNPNSETSIEAV